MVRMFVCAAASVYVCVRVYARLRIVSARDKILRFKNTLINLLLLLLLLLNEACHVSTDGDL